MKSNKLRSENLLLPARNCGFYGFSPILVATNVGKATNTGSSGDFMENRDERFRGEAFNVYKNALKAQYNLALGNAQGLWEKEPHCPEGTTQDLNLCCPFRAKEDETPTHGALPHAKFVLYLWHMNHHKIPGRTRILRHMGLVAMRNSVCAGQCSSHV